MPLTLDEIIRRLPNRLPDDDWRRRYAVAVAALSISHERRLELLREVGRLKERVAELEGLR